MEAQKNEQRTYISGDITEEVVEFADRVGTFMKYVIEYEHQTYYLLLRLPATIEQRLTAMRNLTWQIECLK